MNTYSTMNLSVKGQITGWTLQISLLFFSNSNFGQSGENLFNDQFIHEIRIEGIDTISFFQYASKGVYVMCDVDIDGQTMDSTACTTKGNISWAHPKNKKPLKFKLNEFVNGRKYDGIREFYLHNSYEDPSLMREKLTYDICKAAGLHALRTAFCKLFINGNYWGLYTLVEAKDELYKRGFENKNAGVFETLDFGSPCFYSQDPMYWEVENGNPSVNWPRLEKLTSILANTPDNQYLDTIPKYFNMDDFLTYQAINVYLLNFDSFLGYNGNQLYLFDSAIENRFQVIPWDFNASFGLWNTENYNPNTLDAIPSVFNGKCPVNRMTTLTELKMTYLNSLCLLNNVICDSASLNAKITSLIEMLQPAIYSDNRKMPTNHEFDVAVGYGNLTFGSSMNNVPGLRSFVANRWVKIKNDLSDLGFQCTNNLLDNEEESSLVVYPNPAKTSIFLNFKGEKAFTYRIFNTNGQCVSEGELKVGQNETSISHLQDGVYLIEFWDTSTRIDVQRFVKM